MFPQDGAKHSEPMEYVPEVVGRDSDWESAYRKFSIKRDAMRDSKLLCKMLAMWILVGAAQHYCNEK